MLLNCVGSGFAERLVSCFAVKKISDADAVDAHWTRFAQPMQRKPSVEPLKGEREKEESGM